MIDFARAVGDIELVDDDGRPVKVREAWSESTAVVVFIRHFG